MLTKDSIVRSAPVAVSCELDGEAALLNVQSGEYYGLDELGASVWRMITQPCAVATIVQKITSEYAVDPERCGRDLISFIGELAAQSLVEVSENE